MGLSDVSEAEMLNGLLSRGICYRISDMKINGNDIAALGVRGKSIGDLLERLIFDITEGRVENEREALLERVAKFI